MLIRRAELWRRGTADIRIENGRVTAIGDLQAVPEEHVVDARGGLLLPGLHDHHIHLAATAAARMSVPVGPPQVHDEQALAAVLGGAGTGWLRGVGYHESVAGMLDRERLDRWAPDRPVRVQHRSGRMWFLNSAAVHFLRDRTALPAGLDEKTGQLFDEDDWLRRALGAQPPDLAELSEALARMGVTGVTEISPANGPEEAAWLAQQRGTNRLLQRCVIAGRLALTNTALPPGLSVGPVKIHLHEHALGDLDDTARIIAQAHGAGRVAAIHCTTEVELVYALSAIRTASPRLGDRIEHAGLASDDLVEQIAELNLHVVSQPHFIAERGDQYAALVPASEHRELYRLRSLVDASIVLAAGSDAPYGSIDPWAGMRAAMSRTTTSGAIIGEGERLSARAALSLYLRDPSDLAQERDVAVGVAADLCLLDRPWAEARTLMDSAMVRMTLIEGRSIHDRVDQPPS